MTEKDSALFRRMMEYKSVEFNPERFELSSGLCSVYRVHLGRNDVTEKLDLLDMLGRKVLEFLRDAKVEETGREICLIGVPTAGMPSVQEAASINYRESILKNKVVFRMLKRYVGFNRFDKDRSLWTDGEPDSSQDYWLVENVCTTAASIYAAYSKLIEHGYPAEQISILILVDRELNGMNRLREVGIPASKIFVGWKITDLIKQMISLGLLPDEALHAVEKEIAEFHADPPF